MNWHDAGQHAPALMIHPHDAASLAEAHDAIELWERYSHKVLDPPQRLAVEHMMSTDAGGKWAATTTGREMPRQNGKNDEIEVVELWGLVMRGEAILHTAHELATVSGAFERLYGLLDSHKDLRSKLVRPLKGLGQQALHMAGGAVIAYRTRTGGGGRGLDDISRLVVDEAQHAKAEHLASASPTLAVNPNPQTNIMGTAGIASTETDHSKWWWDIRRRALGGDGARFAYLGHTAEVVRLDADDNIEQIALDPEVFGDPERFAVLCHAANPAVAAGRISVEFLRSQLTLLGPERFAREHLGIWDAPKVGGSTGAKIDPHTWRQCADPAGQVVGPVVVAVDTGYNLERSAVAVAGRRADGLRQVEIVQADAGSHWAELALLDIMAGHEVAGVAFDGAGPAEAFAPMLDRITANTDAKLHRLSAAKYRAACAAFVADVDAGTIRHLGDPTLGNVAVSARERRYGDGWCWHRAGGDISPLVAATVALAAADGLAEPVAESSVYDDDDASIF